MVRGAQVNGLEINGDVVVARLRRVADSTARGRDYGLAVVGPLPPRVWALLVAVAEEFDRVAAVSYQAPEFPWTPMENTGPIIIDTARGRLQCWPTRSVGWGRTGSGQSDTREG
jgi:hypothetical protein